MKVVKVTEIRGDGAVVDKTSAPVKKTRATDLGLSPADVEKLVRDRQGKK